ncbi:hypothetical protein LTS08_001469 [Lithohypha guttulata]|uniref:uncharacterized protein n=1 Tax=Lithohypha guttulata TaxID=1690604 RepID=UPI002DE12759|nr:hypothetical protein LTR51_003866 [Lithohypha guttulata]KAK5105195.1 hypothetical protein LTS08_001469 [Lithohypha guttulata]
MSFLDPIASGINSLLNPLTSGLGSDATSATSDASTPATASIVESTTATSVLVTTPSSSSSSSTLAVSPTSTATISAAKTPLSTSQRPSETSSSTRSTASSSASSIETTFSTSSTRASTSSISSSTTSSNSLPSSQTRTSASSISTPAAPSATPEPTISSVSEPSSDGNKVSTAGIVIAAIVAFIVVVGIIYLICRFCPPIRKRLDAWHVKRHKERSYREGIDGPTVPEKDVDAGAYASLHSRSTSSEVGQKVGSLRLASDNTATVSTATLVPTTGLVKEIDVAVPPTAVVLPPLHQKRNSLLNLAYKPNSLLPTSAPHLKTPYNSHPHYLQGLDAANATTTYDSPIPVLQHKHQRGYTIPTSHTHHPPASLSQHNNGYGLGLGLGSVSMLRNNSLLSRKAGQHPRPETTGPTINATPSKTATAGHGRTRSESQEVNRKPLPPVVMKEKQPPPLPPAVANTYHTSSERSQSGSGRAALAHYPSTATPSPAAANRASWTHGDEEVLSVAPRATETENSTAPVKEENEQDREPTIPDIHIEAPSPALPQAVERISQIGMAVSSTPPPGDRAASNYVGMAK